MGRHSSPEQGPFYLSLFTWFLPWVLIAAVAGVAVSIAVDALGQDELETPPPAAATSPAPSPTPTPTPTPEATPSVEETPTPKETKSPEPVKLITKGITVQVLNGTNDPDADDAMVDRLARLGYEVISVEGASRQYERTTVFWSLAEGRDAAEALADRFGWIAQEKPANLSPTVDLHVVVGIDER
jgi:hypothetical protein